MDKHKLMREALSETPKGRVVAFFELSTLTCILAVSLCIALTGMLKEGGDQTQLIGDRTITIILGIFGFAMGGLFGAFSGISFFSWRLFKIDENLITKYKNKRRAYLEDQVLLAQNKISSLKEEIKKLD